MAPPSLRERWGQGATTLGAWISLREPLLAEGAALAGFDYIMVDMQHGIVDIGDVTDDAAGDPARRQFRSYGCRGTSRGSSAGCSTPGRWA